MCVQCMMGATTAVGTASGLRSWLATRHWAWLTPQRLHRITVGLVVAALVASATVLSGSS
jgi:hypothetical protein